MDTRARRRAIRPLCLAYFGVEDGIEHARPGERGRAAMHVAAAFALLAVLAFKIVVVRWWHRVGKYLPVIGLRCSRSSSRRD